MTSRLYAYSVRKTDKAGPILCAAHVMAADAAEARAKAEAEFRQPMPAELRQEAPEFFDAVEAKRADAIRAGFVIVVTPSKAKNPAEWV